MSYRADRGGHAPGHLRDAFLEWLEDDPEQTHVSVDEEPRSVRWLFGQLWSCTDILPRWAHEEVEAILGHRIRGTYAAAARRLSRAS